MCGSIRLYDREREGERREKRETEYIERKRFLDRAGRTNVTFSVRPRAAEMMSVDIVSLVGVCVLADGERET